MKIKNFIPFLIYIFRFISCKNNQTFFRCGVDDHKIASIPAKNYAPINNKKRKLNNEEFKDFKIYLDLINIKKGIKDYNLEKYEELFISSLNKAIETLQKLLKVKRLDGVYKFNDFDIKYMGIQNWNKTIIGSSAKDFQTLGIDLVIFGRFKDDMDDSTLASAGISAIIPESGQPLIGFVNINANANYSKINSKEYFQSIVLHEFTHILGFVYDHLNNFQKNIYNKTDKYGIKRFYINSPKVIEVAKKYYNCPHIEGVELEEFGGTGTAGSHWEERILLGEYMNGIIYPEEQVISEFTLALLEDTGYYKANYYTGGLMRYGKGKGCDFIYNRCVNSTHDINELFENEFYDSIVSPHSIDSSCSSGRQSRTYFAWWKYDNIPEYYQYFSSNQYGGFSPADYCPVARGHGEENQFSYYIGHCSRLGGGGYGTKIQYEKTEQMRVNSTHVYVGKHYYYNKSGQMEEITGETYSDHSFCYQSTLIKNNKNFYSNVVRAVCYESFCSDYSLTIKINDDYIVCPRTGGKIIVEGYKGYFMCPDYNLICSGTIMCNNMFECVDKKSEAKDNSYIYDYKIKTSQNIESFEITEEDEINNYELAQNGICSINCKHCELNNKCLKCRNNYGLISSKENKEITCLPLSQLSEGFYQYNNIFYNCMNNCIICSNNISCDKCIDNYEFKNNKCLKIISNCKIYGNDDLCDECKEGYILDENNRNICLKKKEIFIIQVQIINNHLKIYFIISTGVEKEINIKISVELYKYNNNFRNIEESIIENLELNLFSNVIGEEPGYINEFTSEEEFNDNDRIVVNISSEKNNIYKLKLLNNDNKILDTEQNKKMIENKEIIDFSKIGNSNYVINNYIIKSISKGCNFDLTSDTPIKERKQNLILNFYEKDSINNNINITCLLSNENNNKIPCSLEKEINNKNYGLNSYIGGNNESLFYIMQDTDINFQLKCINEIEQENKKEKKSNKTLIIIIIVVVVAVLVIIGVIIIIIHSKMKKEKNVMQEKKGKKIKKEKIRNNINDIKNSERNGEENNDMDISFSDR